MRWQDGDQPGFEAAAGKLGMEVSNLDTLSPRCLFAAIPLKIKKGSGSPIRPLAFCED